mmetsp:Transcript_4012/g.9865  ORF Transcript_4012/g.9865 Transcript_4012/m.9865 type:complete len:268 (+) Transcript_4012:31-834(+)
MAFAVSVNDTQNAALQVFSGLTQPRHLKNIVASLSRHRLSVGAPPITRSEQHLWLGSAALDEHLPSLNLQHAQHILQWSTLRQMLLWYLRGGETLMLDISFGATLLLFIRLSANVLLVLSSLEILPPLPSSFQRVFPAVQGVWQSRFLALTPIVFAGVSMIINSRLLAWRHQLRHRRLLSDAFHSAELAAASRNEHPELLTVAKLLKATLRHVKHTDRAPRLPAVGVSLTSLNRAFFILLSSLGTLSFLQFRSWVMPSARGSGTLGL